MKSLTSLNRRNFIKNTSAAAAGITMIKPFAIASENPKKQIRLGFIGCGSRGQMVCNQMIKHGGYNIVAAADYFQDRLDEFSEKFDIPSSKLYSGLTGYQKLLDDKSVDAVAIESPPYFHPEQAEAAVKAGKHVYLAKPIAVDVPGSQSVEQSGKLATQKGLCFLVDFQTRANASFREAVRLVQNGAIGDYSFGQSYYHANNPFEKRSSTELLREDPSNPEYRLRAWGLDRTLSGDIITEQNIHTIDVSSWIMNEAPLSAVGNCSGKTRDLGDCNDHFSVIYYFNNGVDVAFTSRQFSAGGTQPAGIYNRMFGTDGALETTYSGKVILRGDPFYRGDSTNLYVTGIQENLETFHQSILKGDATNSTVGASVQSNLMTILGREAAYSRKILTWEELLQEKALKLDLDLRA